MENKSIDNLAGETALLVCKGEDCHGKLDIDHLENLTTKALGVLQEQGVYAMMVFLFSRSGNETLDNYLKEVKKNGEKIAAIELVEGLVNSLREDPIKSLNVQFEEVLNGNLNKKKKRLLQHFLNKISGDLEKLLFVKEFYEQTLIYVRHIAKGMKK